MTFSTVLSPHDTQIGLKDLGKRSYLPTFEMKTTFARLRALDIYPKAMLFLTILRRDPKMILGLPGVVLGKCHLLIVILVT